MHHQQIAVVFPGQGSQTLGMLSDIAQKYQEVRTVFNMAAEVLGYDLWQIIQEGSQEKLDQTAFTQPILLTASYAIWQILNHFHLPKPVFLAGHSLGEYTALLCAGALTFADALKIVSARGQYMQHAAPEGIGGMAAIVGLSNETVFALCQEIKSQLPHEVLAPANFNSIGQVVLAGHQTAIQQAVDLAKLKGAKLAIKLPVSVPSHCDLMKNAALQLAELLNTVNIQKPVIPVINNADVKIYENPEDIRQGLVRQLYLPVRWVETVEYLVNHQITTIIECGPGKVLTGLNKRINKSLGLYATANLSELDQFIQQTGALC